MWTEFTDTVRRAFSSGGKSSLGSHVAAPQRPSAKGCPREQALANQLAGGGEGQHEPPFYALPARWLEDWQKHILHGGPPPGPIGNAEVVTRADSDTQLRWVSTDAWHLLALRYGGGPALRRWCKELLPDVPPALPPMDQGRGASSSADMEKRIRRAAQVHEAWHQVLRSDLALEAERLREGPWNAGAQTPGTADVVVAARDKVLLAIGTEFGGEELRGKLRQLRNVGEDEASIVALSALVQGLCVHEEAQTVLACLLQALLDSDRLGLEMWLEQAEAMGLEAHAHGSPLLGPLNIYLIDMADQERRALESHAAAQRQAEGPDARLWKLALMALEEDDEESLRDVVTTAREAGVDPSAMELCMEELYTRRRRQRANQDPIRGGSAWTGAETSWRNDDDDFLESFRRKRREEAENPPSAQRRNSERVNSQRSSQGGRTSGRRSAGGTPKSGSRADFPFGEHPSHHSEGYGASEQWWSERRGEEDPEDPFARYHTSFGADQGSGRSNAYASTGRATGTTGGAPRWDAPGEWTSTDDFLKAWREKKEREESEARSRTEKEAEEARRRRTQEANRRADQWRKEREAEEARKRSAENARRSAQEQQQRQREQQQQQQQQRQRIPRPSPLTNTTDQALIALGFVPPRVPPLADLKAAYKTMALKHHPDRPQNRGREEEAKAEFQKIKAAFDLLASFTPR